MNKLVYMEKEKDSNTHIDEKTDAKTEKKSAPACCAGCVRWEKFGKSCYYYWEGKKHCTMWTSDWNEASLQ